MSEDLGRLTDGNLGQLTDEDLGQLTDEDLEATRLQMGEHILQLWQEGQERRAAADRSLLDAVARARWAQEGEQE